MNSKYSTSEHVMRCLSSMEGTGRSGWPAGATAHLVLRVILDCATTSSIGSGWKKAYGENQDLAAERGGLSCIHELIPLLHCLEEETDLPNSVSAEERSAAGCIRNRRWESDRGNLAAPCARGGKRTRLLKGNCNKRMHSSPTTL